MAHRTISRRAFLAGLAAAPVLAGAQVSGEPKPKVVGYLSGGQGPESLAKILARRGYVEGRNLRIEARIPADWEPRTLARAAEELVALRPDALYALHANRVGALAHATKTIPIVCGGMPDPVGAGFAKSLRRPGGNVTGLSFGFPESADIQIGLVKAIRPRLKRVGVIFHAASLAPGLMGSWWVEACRAANLEWVPRTMPREDGADEALAPLAGEATFVPPMKTPGVSAKVVAAATRLKILTLGRVEEGAFMNYSMEHGDSEGRIAAILDQVLRGGDPATIPFELPERPAFQLNRKTARALGVEVPAEVLLRVTEFVD